MNLTQRITDLLGGLGLGKRAQVAIVGVILLAGIWAAVRWTSAPAWVPAMVGLPLEQVGAVKQRLEQEGIQYELRMGGTALVVREQDVARARVALASDGLLKTGRPGLELFDQPSWGMTDFIQRVNYRRALEGELERTIGKMRGVNGATVHLALQETSRFRRGSRLAEASVVIRTPGTGAPDPQVVRGVAFLVASSVDGLVSENVTVLDDSGRLLSASVESGSPTAVGLRQLEMRREVEHYLETKSQELVVQIVGPGNARVRVAAALSFDRIDRTVESIETDQQLVTQEQKAEIIPGNPEQGAGSMQSAVVFDAPRSVEHFTSGTGSIQRLTVAVMLNDRVLPDGTVVPRTSEELQRIESLIVNTVGIDEQRGDEISVVSVPFEVDPSPLPVATDDGTGIWEIVQMVQRPLISIAGLLVAFLLGMRILRGLSAAPGGATARRLAATPGGMALTGSGAGAPGGDASHAGASAAEPSIVSERERAVASVLERPEVAARLVRTWMSEN